MVKRKSTKKVEEVEEDEEMGIMMMTQEESELAWKESLLGHLLELRCLLL